jgi:hypothetical protein
MKRERADPLQPPPAMVAWPDRVELCVIVRPRAPRQLSLAFDPPVA